VTFRDEIACAIYGADWDGEGFLPQEEWSNYSSPWKQTYYMMADKVVALFVAEYGEFLPIGPDELENCPVDKVECCGWHGACRTAFKIDWSNSDDASLAQMVESKTKA